VKIVWDWKGNVMGKASQFSRYILVLKRPQGNLMFWKRGLTKQSDSDISPVRPGGDCSLLSRWGSSNPSGFQSPGWRSLLFCDLTCSQTPLLEERY